MPTVSNQKLASGESLGMRLLGLGPKLWVYTRYNYSLVQGPAHVAAVSDGKLSRAGSEVKISIMDVAFNSRFVWQVFM